MKTDHQFRNMRVRNSGKRLILALEEAGFKLAWITPYQCRVDGRLDLYPTGRKYHDLRTGERGMYSDALEIAMKSQP